MTRGCTLLILAVAMALAMGPSARAQKDKTDTDQPQLSGMVQGNVGCAVLEKHTPIKGKLLAIGVVYARTEYVVLATFNAKPPKEKFTGPGDVKDLNQWAVKDRIKLVVIPSKYTDAQLEQAKSICQKPSEGAPKPPAGPAAP